MPRLNCVLAVELTLPSAAVLGHIARPLAPASWPRRSGRGVGAGSVAACRRRNSNRSTRRQVLVRSILGIVFLGGLGRRSEPVDAHRLRQGRLAAQLIRPPALAPGRVRQLFTDYERGDRRPVFATAVGAGEERILPIGGHRPFILPMSVRSRKFTTAGTPISAIRFACGALSGERQANFFRF